jgi:hypothetical protein
LRFQPHNLRQLFDSDAVTGRKFFQHYLTGASFLRKLTDSLGRP